MEERSAIEGDPGKPNMVTVRALRNCSYAHSPHLHFGYVAGQEFEAPEAVVIEWLKYGIVELI